MNGQAVLELNNSAHSPYHSQVDNAYFPLSTCNTTSAVMWLLNEKIPFETPAGLQPEDHLTRITETPEAMAVMRERFPWAFKDGRPVYRPREVHGMLDWAVNKLVGREVITFRQDVSLAEFARMIVAGHSAIVTGRFTDYGHMIVLHGLRTAQGMAELLRDGPDLAGVLSWIVDDPYGDYHQGYLSKHGNDRSFAPDQFNSLTRAYGEPLRKWAHLPAGWT